MKRRCRAECSQCVHLVYSAVPGALRVRQDAANILPLATRIECGTFCASWALTRELRRVHHEKLSPESLLPSHIFKPSETVDFVIVGSGAAGGVIARELSQAGFSVVVLEQGPRLGTRDFEHDELKYQYLSGITNNPATSP